MNPDPNQVPARPPNPVPATSDDSGFSFAQALPLARKYLLLVLACWVTVTAAVLFWTLGQQRVFRGEAMLRLDPDPPKPLGQKIDSLSSNANSYWTRKEFYETEFRVMRSMRVAMSVVRTLGLNSDPGFLSRKSGDHPKPIPAEDAARLLIARLSVEPIKDSSLATIRYEDTDPKRCQTILNTVVRVYLAQNLENTATISTSALEWLNGQLEHLKVDLEKSEIALNDFRQKNNVLSISLEDQHNLLTAQLEAIAKELTRLDIRRLELASRKAEIAKVSPDDPRAVGAKELLESNVLNTLRTSYDEQSAKLEEILATLGEQNPRVQSAQGKLKEIAAAIKQQVVNIKDSVAADLRAIEQQIGALKKKNEELLKEAHELQALETPFNQLHRQKTNNEKIYGLVLERARETDLTRMMNFNNIRVVDEATEPKIPIRPSLPLNLGLGAVAGLVLGITAALGRELSDRTLRTPADVEGQLGVTCLGLLPVIEKGGKDGYYRRHRQRVPSPIAPALNDRDLIVAVRPESGIAEAARAIRTNLTFLSPDRPYRSVLITSAIPEEGKTTVACSMSIVLAQSGHRVLLIDTDLRRPRLHRTFKVSNDIGITMAVTGQAPVDECIQETQIPNLWVLTSGPIPPNPAEMIQSDRFRDMLRELLTKFDRLVLDSPPLLPVTDAAILSQLVDGVALVVRGFKTQRSASRQAIRQLTELNSHIIGVVLNAIDLSRHDYRDYHYYYKRDGYYSLPEKERGPTLPATSTNGTAGAEHPPAQ